MLGIGTRGLGLGEVSSADMPATPSISVAEGENQVTVTVSGSDADATNYIKYKAPYDNEWQDGGSRIGNGDVIVTDLANNVPYIFTAYSDNGIVSTPAVAVLATLYEDIEEPENPFDAAAINSRDHFKSVFGKQIVILPDGVTERTVIAIIDYEVIEKLPGAPHGTSRKITITVDNNAVTGLSGNEFDKVNAKCRLPKKEGASPSEAKIIDIVSQDAGMVTYEVR